MTKKENAADALQDILAERMVKKGINQRQLAAIIGIKESKLSGLLRTSTRKLKLGDIEKVCSALGEDPMKLLKKEET